MFSSRTAYVPKHAKGVVVSATATAPIAQNEQLKQNWTVAQNPGALSRRSFTRVVGLITWTLIILVAGLVLLLSVGSALGLWRADVVLSGSMRPQFSEGSIVLAVKRDATAMMLGDVVMYSPPLSAGVPMVAHRIASIEVDDAGRRTMVTKGDNSNSVDPWGPVVIEGQGWVVKNDIPYLGHIAIKAMAHRVLIGSLAIAIFFAAMARSAFSDPPRRSSGAPGVGRRGGRHGDISSARSKPVAA